MIFNDYYQILNVLPRVTQKEITLAYKSMAKKWHPDKNKGDNATEQMQLITEAYSVLKDIEKRKAYNVRYYKHYQSKAQNKSKAELRIEKCFYCDNNLANHVFSHKATLYKVMKRNYLPQKKVWYKTVNIEIPRCEECYKIHNISSDIFILFPIIAFSLLGIILGITIWNMWIFLMIVGGLVGRVVGGIFSSIDKSIISKESDVKRESNYTDYVVVNKLFKEGWTVNKPIA